MSRSSSSRVKKARTISGSEASDESEGNFVGARAAEFSGSR